MKTSTEHEARVAAGAKNGHSEPPRAPESKPQSANVSRQLATSAVILAGLIGVGFILSHVNKPEQATPAAPSNPSVVSVTEAGKQTVDIETSPASVEALDDSIAATGSVSFPSDRTVKIAPRLAGRVRQVLVRLGDHVTAGQVLAVLDSVDAATAENTYQQNKRALYQAGLDLARFQRLQGLGTPDITAAQSAYDESKESLQAAKTALDLSRRQEAIGGFTQKPLEDATNGLLTAKATLQQAQADMALAQRDYNRKKQLLAIGVVAQTDMEQSQDIFDKARSAETAAEGGVTLAQQAVDRETKAFKSNLYADQTVKQNEAAYLQAKLQQAAALRALQLAKAQNRRDLDAAQTAYSQAKYAYDNSVSALTMLGNPRADGTVAVTSPLSGVVVERDVSPGQVVDQSQETPWQMFVISNPDTVWIDSDVHEADIATIRTGSPVTVKVAAAPGRAFSGSVFSIAPTLDKTSHTVKVRAVLPNHDGLLKDGMYADVSIGVSGTRNKSVVIPLAAVSHEQDGDYAYIQTGGAYHRRLVELGKIHGDRVVVTHGITPGESVVTHGALYLGASVTGD